MNLKLLTNASLLACLHRHLLTRLLEDYKADLPPEAAALLGADLTHEEYCAAWAAQFRAPAALGARLREALIAIETLALPENCQLLEDALSHLPRGYDVNRNLPSLHQALHLWLIAQNTPGVSYPFEVQSSPPALASLPPSPTSPPSDPPPTCNLRPSTCNPAPEAPFEVQSSTFKVQSSPPSSSPLTPPPPHSLTDPATALPSIQQSNNPLIQSAPPSIHQSTNPLIQSAPPSIHQSTNPSILPAAPPIQSDFARLARLSPTDYDHVRHAEAKRLHLRLATLDDAVARARILEDDAQANAVRLPELEPWPEPILNAPALFDQVHDRCLHYLYLPDGAAVVLTLWPAHAHAIAAFTQTPRLNLTSSEPGCGKTTVLDLLATLTPKVMRTDNLKTAVLFRVVDQHQPTLLLDELDSYLHLFPELRGLLNAGDSQGACAYRCEGHAVRSFKAFAATALAGIGHLAPTLRDRSIVISLSKAPAGALQARFDKRRTDTETVLGRQIARWTQDNFAAIAACEPPMPPAAYNRLADNWRPLFAIAQVIGGHWPARALDAFHALNQPKAQIQTPKIENSSPAPAPSIQQSTNPSILPAAPPHSSHPPHPSHPTIQQSNNPSIQSLLLPVAPPHHSTTPSLQSLLLSDLRVIFAQSGTDRLFSAALVNALCSLPNRPWSTANNGHGAIDQTWLARQLRPFGLYPRNLRIANRRAKGYRLADFSNAFAQLKLQGQEEPE